MVMGTVTWAGVAIITDGAEAEGIITDGDTITDDFPLMILWERAADLAAALSIKSKRAQLGVKGPFNLEFGCNLPAWLRPPVCPDRSHLPIGLNGATRVAPFNAGFTIQPKNRPSNIRGPDARGT
jgi:hypothetical protein